MRRLRRRALPAALVLAALASGAVVVVSTYAIERARLRGRQNGVTSPKDAGPLWFQIESRGVIRPATVHAGASGLRPEEEVIGVEVGGRARAYRLGAFRDPAHHIVNDLVGGVPVSVSYCDITDCVQVYTDPAAAAPLDVRLAGLYEGEMVVKLDGTLYFHRSGTPMRPGTSPRPLPYERLPPTRTTWGEWSRRHPGTDVYVGDRPESRPAPAPAD